MKAVSVVVSLLLMCAFRGYSQIPMISLSAYTYSDSTTAIGDICLQPELGEIQSVKVVGSANVILKDRKLYLSSKGKPKRAIDLTVAVKSSKGTYSQDFRLIRDEFLRNKVIAHRGAWKNTGVAENSIASLVQAIKLGCEATEFDVHMSADSVLVINHDPQIQGLPIEKTNASELQKLKLSSGEGMPTLESYLKAGISQNKTRLILEIKPSAISKERGIACSRKVIDMVAKLKAQAWVDYISFDYEICKEIVRIDPFAKVAYLNGDKTPEQLKADNISGFDYHFNVLRKNESWLTDAKIKGLSTNSWTVNDADTILWLLERRIDYITTNEPEQLLKIVRQR